MFGIILLLQYKILGNLPLAPWDFDVFNVSLAEEMEIFFTTSINYKIKKDVLMGFFLNKRI